MYKPSPKPCGPNERHNPKMIPHPCQDDEHRAKRESNWPRICHHASPCTLPTNVTGHAGGGVTQPSSRTRSPLACPGKAGGLRPQPPHRSGREAFPHPVPRYRTFPYDKVAGETPQPASHPQLGREPPVTAAEMHDEPAVNARLFQDLAAQLLLSAPAAGSPAAMRFAMPPNPTKTSRQTATRLTFDMGNLIGRSLGTQCSASCEPRPGGLI